jgi:hypothetical protein
MAIVNLQRQGQQIGRIRIGQMVTAASGKQHPARLDTFRFTTQSEHTARRVAVLYGGTVRPWTEHTGEWEVITKENAIAVMVPPRDAVIEQWNEMWTGGGCARRCDGEREIIGGTPCLCPKPDDPSDPAQVAAALAEHLRLAQLIKPQACKMVTRVKVMIPDLPGLGVFRLDTGSYWAAVEMGDTASLLQAARDQGCFLPAVLRIEHRQRVTRGKTKKFPVPVLEITATIREITSGSLAAGGMAAQLPPPPAGQYAALPAGNGRALPAPPPAESAPAQPQRKPEPPRDQDTLLLDEPMTGGDIPDTPAQRLVYAAFQCRNRAQVESLGEKAEAEGLAGEYVCVHVTEPWEPLRDFLRTRWTELPETRQKPSQYAGTST